ncbi:unnamed protein product [Brugia pahangi]|uniref:Uncharacterized protein n=1 Tax=Brugia pahangi TaxID=6280 RepID=A0A0N4TDP1_BRUPA|nr:unnamed protein product [Brugia pahangi]
MDNWKTNFLTNWDKLDLSKRLRHSKLIILSVISNDNYDDYDNYYQSDII